MNNVVPPQSVLPICLSTVVDSAAGRILLIVQLRKTPPNGVSIVRSANQQVDPYVLHLPPEHLQIRIAPIRLSGFNTRHPKSTGRNTRIMPRPNQGAQTRAPPLVNANPHVPDAGQQTSLRSRSNAYAIRNPRVKPTRRNRQSCTCESIPSEFVRAW